MNELRKIIEVQAEENYNLQVTFDDGKQLKFDCQPFIKNGVSAALKEIDYFKNVKLSDGFIYWENGFDFCPEFLYHHVNF